MTETTSVYPGQLRTIFKDAAHQDSLNRLGYVLGEFLAAGELEQLRELFDRTVRRERHVYEPFRELGYYISIFDEDTGRRREVDRVLKELFRSKIDGLMQDYRILLCNFMAKEPGGTGEIQVHQDFTFVDEDRFVGFNLWVPLEDTDETNGCFCMLPGSHRLLRSFRAASIPDTLTAYNDALKRYMIPTPLKAGTGILFDHKLFHCSADNRSDRWRPAVQLVVIPREADAWLLHYDRERDPEHLRVVEVDGDYLTQRNLWEPVGDVPFVGEKPYIPLPEEPELLRMAEELWTRSKRGETR